MLQWKRSLSTKVVAIGAIRVLLLRSVTSLEFCVHQEGAHPAKPQWVGSRQNLFILQYPAHMRTMSVGDKVEDSMYVRHAR